jgi:hypothetical protein
MRPEAWKGESLTASRHETRRKKGNGWQLQVRKLESWQFVTFKRLRPRPGFSFFTCSLWGDVVLEKKYNFIKTTYDISLDSQISLLPLGFSLQSRDESKG